MIDLDGRHMTDFLFSPTNPRFSATGSVGASVNAMQEGGILYLEKR